MRRALTHLPLPANRIKSIVITQEGEKSFSFEKPKHIGQHLIQQIVDELRDIQKCVSDMYSGARTSWILEEIVKDYYE